MICANINLFGFLDLISCRLLKLFLKELSLSELPLSSTFGPDLSMFWGKSQSKIFVIKPLPPCHDLVNLLILLIKLIANLPKPCLYKCNPPRLNPTLIILLSMMSSYSDDKCLFKLLTASEDLALSVKFKLKSN